MHINVSSDAGRPYFELISYHNMFDFSLISSTKERKVRVFLFYRSVFVGEFRNLIQLLFNSAGTHEQQLSMALSSTSAMATR